MNINIGGTKGWNKIPSNIRAEWKVLDLVGQPDFQHDLNSGTSLPFASNSIANFYTSHTLEHVLHWRILPLLEEIRRCLVDKGCIRIVVPDIHKMVLRYVERDDVWLRRRLKAIQQQPRFYPETHLGVLMQHFYSYTKDSRDGHHMAFDLETLTWLLNKVGFQKIVRMKYGKCSSVFTGLDFKRHAENSLYVEAQK